VRMRFLRCPPTGIGRCPGFLTGLVAALPLAAPVGPRSATVWRTAGCSSFPPPVSPGGMRAAVVCLDGHSFAVSAMPGHGNAATPAAGIL